MQLSLVCEIRMCAYKILKQSIGFFLLSCKILVEMNFKPGEKNVKYTME